MSDDLNLDEAIELVVELSQNEDGSHYGKACDVVLAALTAAAEREAVLREENERQRRVITEQEAAIGTAERRALDAELTTERLTGELAEARSFCPDLLSDLLAIFTSHGIASRGQTNLACDVIAWAAMGARQTHNEVIAAILRDPHGCRFCDSGKLRNPEKDHDVTCGYKLAALIGLTAAESTQEKPAETTTCMALSEGEGWHCSLPSSHTGPHRAFTGHDLKSTVLIEWGDPTPPQGAK